MSIFTKKDHSSVLGISIDQNQITLAVVEKNGKGVRVSKTATATMALDILSNEPELVAQEIRNHLQTAGITETHCVFSIPVQWVMSQWMELPTLAKEDESNFIQLHAEREFPFPLQDLSVSNSIFQENEDQKYAFVSAVPSRQVETIKTIFQIAKLNLVSITVGIANFEEYDDLRMVLQKREQGTNCFIQSKSSIIFIRNFEYNSSEYENEFEFDTDRFKREMRITLSQLPKSSRANFNQIHLYGPESWCDSIQHGISSLPDFSNIAVEHKTIHQFIHQMDSPVCSYQYSAAVGSAYSFIQKQKSELEYLPPYVSRIERIFKQVSSKRNLVIGEVAAVFLVIFAGLFGYQYWQYSQLSSRWDAIADQVAELETIQQNMKTYRPWFHQGMPSLMVMKTVTDTFPEEGSIWVKSLQIENESMITCNGFAENNQVFLSTYDRLKEQENIGLLQVKQQSGNAPMQYSFQFQWSEG